MKYLLTTLIVLFLSSCATISVKRIDVYPREVKAPSYSVIKLKNSLQDTALFAIEDSIIIVPPKKKCKFETKSGIYNIQVACEGYNEIETEIRLLDFDKAKLHLKGTKKPWWKF